MTIKNPETTEDEEEYETLANVAKHYSSAADVDVHGHAEDRDLHVFWPIASSSLSNNM
jgi:hypothetical protein